jgi:hypothetical protein
MPRWGVNFSQRKLKCQAVSKVGVLYLSATEVQKKLITTTYDKARGD